VTVEYKTQIIVMINFKTGLSHLGDHHNSGDGGETENPRECLNMWYYSKGDLSAGYFWGVGIARYPAFYSLFLMTKRGY
jgi:hypothetical protein